MPRLRLDPTSPTGVSFAPEREIVRNTNGYVGTRKLRELDEVLITGTPSDDQALAYDAASGKWIPQTITGSGSGATNLDGLTDVIITTPANGQVLKFNGTDWINDADATTSGTGATNLSTTTTATTVTVVSDTGTDALINGADGSIAGIMTAADKTKLNGIATGATANATDAFLRLVDNHTDGTTNRLYTATEKTKLAGIATGATANNTDAFLLSTDNHTSGTTNKVYTATEQTKLTGIATGATANSTDAHLLGRANHTGTQAASTITGLATVATSGSYTDLLNQPDLTALNDVKTYINLAGFPATGTTDFVYIAEDTGYMYRWNGTSYTQLTDQTAIWGQVSGTLSNQTDLQNALNAKAASTDLTTHTGATAAHGATGAIVGTTNTQTLTNKTLTSPVINTPTGIAKADVGLGNVDNTSDAAKPVSTAQQTALNAKANLSGAVDIEITDATKGIILRSPNATRWRLTVGDDGAITTTAVV